MLKVHLSLPYTLLLVLLTTTKVTNSQSYTQQGQGVTVKAGCFILHTLVINASCGFLRT